MFPDADVKSFCPINFSPGTKTHGDWGQIWLVFHENRPIIGPLVAKKTYENQQKMEVSGR